LLLALIWQADCSEQIEGIAAGGLKTSLGATADGVAVGQKVVKPVLHCCSFERYRPEASGE